MVQSVVIVVAGGFGKRMLHDRPKQYVPLAGIPILARTLIPFEKAPSIDRIILVVPDDDRKYVKDEIIDRYRITKVKQVQVGGEARQDSVRKGLEVLDDGDDIVLIHDGVRPFVTQELIERSIGEAVRSGAVIPVVPTADTVKVIGEDGSIRDTLDRTDLRLAQTPQAFKREIILEAFESACRDGFYGTDDASLVERLGGIPVRTIPGLPYNIKITTPEDLLLGEFLFNRGQSII